MKKESLGQRTKRLIAGANLSPRILAAVTKIHFTTIYAIIRDRKGDGDSYPITVETLTNTLDCIDKLLASGKLPFDSGMSHDKRAETLKTLLDEI